MTFCVSICMHKNCWCLSVCGVEKKEGSLTAEPRGGVFGTGRMSSKVTAVARLTGIRSHPGKVSLFAFTVSGCLSCQSLCVWLCKQEGCDNINALQNPKSTVSQSWVLFSLRFRLKLKKTSIEMYFYCLNVFYVCISIRQEDCLRGDTPFKFCQWGKKFSLVEQAVTYTVS